MKVGMLGALLLLAPVGALAAQVAGPKEMLVIGRKDFALLRWIEGKWEGSGEGVPTFWERYRFVDDSTLVVEHFADGRFTKVTDRSRYELRNHRLGNTGPGPRWVAVGIDTNLVHFKPVSGATNAFMWKRLEKNRWVAALAWPATVDRPAREVAYTMKRK